MVEVREMRSGEADALGAVMHSAIHEGTSLYTAAQRAAWLALPNCGEDWADRLDAQTVWVALADASPIGFVTLATGSYIDFAYVQADAQGQGVFSLLLATLEDVARASPLPRLWTHASLMAEPAFAARGFHVTRRETVTRADQSLARAEMEKVLL